MEGLKTEPMLKKVSLKRMVHRTSTTTGLIAGAGIIVLVFLTLMEVVKRYFLNSPTSWVLEISELLIVFGAFLGMAYALQVGAHEVCFLQVGSPEVGSLQVGISENNAA